MKKESGLQEQGRLLWSNDPLVPPATELVDTMRQVLQASINA